MNKKGEAVSMAIITFGLVGFVFINAAAKGQLTAPNFKKEKTVDDCSLFFCQAHGPIPVDQTRD